MASTTDLEIGHFGRALERLVDAPLPREVHDGMNWI
jgi:hypothetical protein